MVKRIIYLNVGFTNHKYEPNLIHMKKAIEKTIVLTGMMGVGKTHIGRLLAKKMGVSFVDSDEMVVQKAGMGIQEIFEKFGEGKFREVEHKTIMELLERPPCVLSIGGGALGNPQTLNALKTRTTLVWIDVPLDVIWERVKDCKHRPLLQTDNPCEKLKSLISERTPFYEQAHLRVKNDTHDVRKAIDDIIKALS